MSKLQNKPIFPSEIIDRILIELGDIAIAIELDSYYAVKQLYKLDLYLYKVDWPIQYGYIQYINHLNDKKFSFIKENIKYDFKYLTVLKYLYRYKSDPALVAINPSLAVVKFLHEFNEPCTINTMEEAAIHGHLGVVKFLHSTGSSYVIDNGKFHDITNSSIDNDIQLLEPHLLSDQLQAQLLNNLRQQLLQLQPIPNHMQHSLPIIDLIIKIKKIVNEQLQILLRNTTDWEVIELINQQYQPIKNALEQTLNRQLENKKNIMIIKLLKNVKESFIRTMDFAVKNNHHEIVEFLHCAGFKYSMHIMDKSIISAMETNNIEMVKVLYKIGGIENEKILEWSIKAGHLDVVKIINYKFSDQQVILASEYGHLEIVKFFYENGIECNEYAIIWASRKGHLKVVKYLHEIGIKCTPRAMNWAIGNYHSDVAKFLHSVGIKCSEGIMLKACKTKNVRKIKLLHEIEEKCPDDAIYWMVEDGDLEMVKFLHSIGAQYNKKAMTCASKKGNLEMVKLLNEIGVECSTRAINAATIAGHSEVYTFLKSIKK